MVTLMNALTEAGKELGKLATEVAQQVEKGDQTDGKAETTQDVQDKKPDAQNKEAEKQDKQKPSAR